MGQADIYERALGKPLPDLWHRSAQAKINSVKLERQSNLDPQDVNGTESYIILYRMALIGSNPHAALHFPDKGMEPFHAAILYFNGRFYLEKLCDLTDVGVNSLAVAVGEESDTIEEIYEPYLIQEGFLNRTARGRQATPLAYRHFGLNSGKSVQRSLF